MSDDALLVGIDSRAAPVRRATVRSLRKDGSVVAAFADAELPDCPCDVLRTSERAELVLAVGDTVVVLLPERRGAKGVVLGRIGPARAVEEAAEEPPAELVIEARKNLVLKVGDGSITIREDGKILIKGNDLVSHAKRTNRIKGGAVSIN